MDKPFIVIQGNSIVELTNLVNTAYSQKYEVSGGIIVDPTTQKYVIGMVKNEFQPAEIIPGVPMINAFQPSRLRNDFTGWVGTKFTVGSKDIQVFSLGRISVVGNSGQHTVRLVNTSVSGDVASVTIPQPLVPADQFSYVPLAAPVTLTAGTTYYLISEEVSGGDQWYDLTVVQTLAYVTVNQAAFMPAGGPYFTIGDINTTYGPASLTYKVAGV
jgi:hypothetical protein